MKKQEGIGDKFNLEEYLQARKASWQGLQNLASAVVIGDTEDSLMEKHLEFFPEQSRSWHPPKIRIAKDTTCSFRDKSEQRKSIEKGDLFFFDFGPVINDHEADVGQTFRLGDSAFENPAQLVFKKCEKLWQETGLSGTALYEKANQFANELNLIVNPKMAGHRLGDFPHSLFFKGSLQSIDFKPCDHLWVLEIHLIDESKNIGYFYEDILGVED